MSKKKSGMQIYTKQDKAILYCGYVLLALFLIAIIVPMVYIVIASFMDPVTSRTNRYGSASKTRFFIRYCLPSFP